MKASTIEIYISKPYVIKKKPDFTWFSAVVGFLFCFFCVRQIDWIINRYFDQCVYNLGGIKTFSDCTMATHKTNL